SNGCLSPSRQQQLPWRYRGQYPPRQTFQRVGLPPVQRLLFSLLRITVQIVPDCSEVHDCPYSLGGPHSLSGHSHFLEFLYRVSIQNRLLFRWLALFLWSNLRYRLRSDARNSVRWPQPV